jgi:hypothetical protein
MSEETKMPWTRETPYVAKLYSDTDREPQLKFYDTADPLEQEIERHKRSGLYSRIWTGHGKSAEQNEWQEIGNWERGG